MEKTISLAQQLNPDFESNLLFNLYLSETTNHFDVEKIDSNMQIDKFKVTNSEFYNAVKQKEYAFSKFIPKEIRKQISDDAYYYKFTIINDDFRQTDNPPVLELYQQFYEREAEKKHFDLTPYMNLQNLNIKK